MKNATILPGVHIGDGAIIGANAVVGIDVDIRHCGGESCPPSQEAV